MQYKHLIKFLHIFFLKNYKSYQLVGVSLLISIYLQFCKH